MKQIKDLDVTDKKVLVRCDFNVPVDDQGNILDDFRIKKTLPTIQYLMTQGAKIILMSHLGEPHGNVMTTLTLDKVKERLEELLKVSIAKASDCIGNEVAKQVMEVKPGQILLLENLRFHQEETDNNPQFAKALSELGEAYVNDAFGDCHRSDASMVTVPRYLPSAMGLLVQKETQVLKDVLENPKKPMAVLVGGIKVKTKAKFIDNISNLADVVMVSGLIKKDIVEENIRLAHPEKIISPVGSLDSLDIDEKTIELFTKKIAAAKTVLWNGPFGKFEDAKYQKGTLQIAKAIIESGAWSVVGGGETVEFLNKEGMIDKFSHVSTGGGAMLDFLSGEQLPGLKALE